MANNSNVKTLYTSDEVYDIKVEHRSELDNITFYEMVEGFLERMNELGVIKDVEYDRVMKSGKVSHTKGKSNSIRLVMKRLYKYFSPDLKMKDVTGVMIHNLFNTPSRKELRDIFKYEIYFKYY